MAGLIRKLVEPAVGLAAEAYAHNKAKKGPTPSQRYQQQVEQEQRYQSGGTPPPFSSPQGPSDYGAPHQTNDSPYGRASPHGGRSSPHGSGSGEYAAPPGPPPSSHPNEKHGGYPDEKNAGYPDNPPPYTPAADEEEDEEDWELDEAAAQVGPAGSQATCVPRGHAGGPPSVEELVRAYLNAYPVRPSGLQLPCPVILPQKRPGERSRGFVHGYAPVLADLGISERAWMDFLASFEAAIQVSPAFDAVNMACGVVGLVGNVVPSPSVQAATTAITIADDAAKHAHERVRTNEFLAEMNRSFFQPLGLYCLLVYHDPQSNSAARTFDLPRTLAKASAQPAQSGIKAYWKSLQGAHGYTRGQAQLPQAAELVFPDVDRAQDSQGAQGAQGAQAGSFKRSMAFVGDYMDRRSQARYASQNPGSSLSMQPQFESNFGNVGTSRTSKKEARRRMRGQAPKSGGPVSLLLAVGSGGRLRGQDARPMNVIRRVMKPGVMYLMVTNLPSQREIEAAMAGLEITDASAKGPSNQGGYQGHYGGGYREGAQHGGYQEGYPPHGGHPGEYQADPYYAEERHGRGPLHRGGHHGGGPLHRGGGHGPLSRGGHGPLSRGGHGPLSRGGHGPLSRGGHGPLHRGGHGPLSRGGHRHDAQPMDYPPPSY